MMIEGQSYLMDGKRYRCTLVNECRAVLAPIDKTVREIISKAGTPFEKHLTVKSFGPSISVAPTSELKMAATL